MRLPNFISILLEPPYTATARARQETATTTAGLMHYARSRPPTLARPFYSVPAGMDKKVKLIVLQTHTHRIIIFPLLLLLLLLISPPSVSGGEGRREGRKRKQKEREMLPNVPLHGEERKEEREGGGVHCVSIVTIALLC